MAYTHVAEQRGGNGYGEAWPQVGTHSVVVHLGVAQAAHHSTHGAGCDAQSAVRECVNTVHTISHAHALRAGVGLGHRLAGPEGQLPGVCLSPREGELAGPHLHQGQPWWLQVL